MRIAELFCSLQGEGRLTGTASIFVRTSGCNLRCGYCDTPFASWTPEGEELSVEEVVLRVEQRASTGDDTEAITHVVVTGGEPMLYAELIPLCRRLRELGKHITIETAGTLYLPVDCDLMSISPKMRNSTPAATGDPRWTWRHETVRHAPDIVRYLVAEYDYQVKFVVDKPDDLPEIEAYLAVLPEIDRRKTMLMPQGTDPDQLAEKAAWIKPYCDRHAFTFCPRRQIEWFGARRGT
ncbi:MAG: 7-carboxy-7-deazaguanine synthase QueE [Patescibacteria group bacterium]|nr:7-carboxy-7-deazaguanine synthase QueE [Patescibacteria group bacterium]